VGEQPRNTDLSRKNAQKVDPRCRPLAQEIPTSLDRAADRIDVSSLRVWFEGTTAVVLAADALIVAVPNTFAEAYISTRFKDILEEELRSLLSPAAEIRLAIGRFAPHN
jgi:chromosomal replication initiation ATPase DnaA